MDWEIFGMAAGAVTVSGFIPQIIQGYRTKHLKDLSYLLVILLSLGMTMWIVYGFHIKSISVIVANFVGLAFNLTLMGMKWYYGKKK